VLLIRPNSVNIVASPAPLGLGYLAQALRERRGDEVRILDARIRRLAEEEVLDAVRDFNPRIVGVTALSFDAKEAHHLAGLIKSDRSGGRDGSERIIVFGGPYASARGEPILEDSPVDYLVLGEGEATLVELINALEGQGGIEDVAGIIRRENGEPVRNRPRVPEEELDRLSVAWDLIEPERYFSPWIRTSENTLQRSSRMLSIFTSRGCPYNCIFCHNLFGRKFRARSPENVVQEIRYLAENYRTREFEIIDDSFNLDLERAKTIARMTAELPVKLHLTFPNGLRADRMDEELLSLLKRAGTYRIDYAVESAIPRVQEMMGKRLDLSRAAEVIAETSSRRILTAGYFILGFPGETEHEMRATVEWALNSRLHIASFFYLHPFPGTPLANSSPELAARVKNMDFSDYSTITINLSAVPDELMRKIRRSAYRGFYFHPSRIARNLRDAPKNFRTLMSVFDIIRLSLKDSVNY
jgi:anaerobic magnesium-protoporphyrin IX monomethyl ester cyclase